MAPDAGAAVIMPPVTVVARSNATRVHLIGGLWAAVVALKLGGAAGVIVATSGALASLASVAVVLSSPAYALGVIPYVALLSPVIGFMPLAGGRVLVSDIFTLILLTQLLLLLAASDIRIRLEQLTSIPMQLAVVFWLSTITGVLLGTLVSLKPLLFLLQLSIIGIYTVSFATTEADWDAVLKAWLRATTLGSVILIAAYMNGERLDMFADAARESINRSGNPTDLFRATYYYSGFHFALGFGLVATLLRAFFLRTVRGLFINLAVAALLLVALLLMLTKTAIASALVAIAGVFLVLVVTHPMRALTRLTLVTGIVLFVGGWASGLFFGFIGEQQSAGWLTRLMSLGSAATRGEVIRSALSLWVSYPLQVVIGFGPDFLDGSGTELATRFKTSSVTGYIEGTVDSGWVSYLIELGIIGFVMLLVIFMQSLRGAVGALRKVSGRRAPLPVTVAILGSLLFLMTALSTQMLGYSKISWLALQLMLIGYMQRSYHTVERVQQKELLH